MTQWKNFPDTTPPRGLPLRLEVKEKDQNTGTPEPYYGKTLLPDTLCGRTKNEPESKN